LIPACDPARPTATPLPPLQYDPPPVIAKVAGKLVTLTTALPVIAAVQLLVASVADTV
jgi:hypothetical protein